MQSGTYTFKLGIFECVALFDTRHTYESPAEFLFTNAPQDRLAEALRAHNIALERWSEWVSPYTCLLIKTGSHNVLVDTGVGSTFAPTQGELLSRLEALGVAPETIDIVLLTHAHGDHCGGNARADGSAAFKQARYLMHQAEWDHWTAPATLAQAGNEWMVPVVEKDLKPLRDHFELIEDDLEIVPGIDFICAPGHTPGHMVVRVSSEGEQLWYLSDAFLHPIHIEQPDWYASVDVHPEQAVSTRKSLLNQVMAGQPLIHCFHFPFPGLGAISRKGSGYHWRELEVENN